MAIPLSARFELYDRMNPDVYSAFKKFSGDLRAAGRSRASAALIFERIRWETMVRRAVREPGLPVLKLNNSYRAFYARKLAAEDRSFDGFFETRVQRSRAQDDRLVMA